MLKTAESPFITEGKYWNQLKKIRKFRVVLSSGSHEAGSTGKKVTASDSANPGPHIHIFHLISVRSEVTFGSNLVWSLLYMGR